VIVIMDEGATEAQVQAVIDRLVELEFTVHRSTGMVHTVLGGVGPEEVVEPSEFEVMDGVKECRRIISPYKLASRHFRPSGTQVKVGGASFGGDAVVMMAGPGLVENKDQIEKVAEAAAGAGAQVLMGGVKKARLHAPAPAGLGEEGLRLLWEAAGRHGLAVASEVADANDIELFVKYVDLLMVESGNTSNCHLLGEIGKAGHPVLLNRGAAATVEEWLLAAERILLAGNCNVILCERGIRTMESPARLTLDINAIPLLKRLTHLPVIVDPSHAGGRRDMVAALARAGVAAGADGVMLEIHPDPDHARAEGAQTLRLETFAELAGQLKAVAAALGRRI